jgi:hypothetical protein
MWVRGDKKCEYNKERRKLFNVPLTLALGEKGLSRTS